MRPTSTNSDKKPKNILELKPPETKPKVTSKPGMKTRTMVKGVSDIKTLREFLEKKKLDRELNRSQAKLNIAQASTHTASYGTLSSVQNQNTSSRLACGDSSGVSKPNEDLPEWTRRGNIKGE